MSIADAFANYPFGVQELRSMRGRPRPSVLSPRGVALLGAVAVGLLMGALLLVLLPAA